MPHVNGECLDVTQDRGIPPSSDLIEAGECLVPSLSWLERTGNEPFPPLHALQGRGMPRSLVLSRQFSREWSIPYLLAGRETYGCEPFAVAVAGEDGPFPRGKAVDDEAAFLVELALADGTPGPAAQTSRARSPGSRPSALSRQDCVA